MELYSMITLQSHLSPRLQGPDGNIINNLDGTYMDLGLIAR